MRGHDAKRLWGDRPVRNRPPLANASGSGGAVVDFDGNFRQHAWRALHHV
jgi:hypothetical protein